ncbi:MAG: DUF1589 domain-containing protein, partial [Rhodopirellula sp. JB055]|uniref:DUF1589 domain-containing protein n=1 Tax=Rhodopirellula sp. JB055 TaxID=3342846 RepID=UPI00370B032A
MGERPASQTFLEGRQIRTGTNGSRIRQEFGPQPPSPGGTWPTSDQTLKDTSKSRLTSSPDRRPGCTWQSSRCLGTKRGVTPAQTHGRDENSPGQ